MYNPFPSCTVGKKIGSSNNSFKSNSYKECNQEKKQRIEMQLRLVLAGGYLLHSNALVPNLFYLPPPLSHSFINPHKVLHSLF